MIARPSFVLPYFVEVYQHSVRCESKQKTYPTKITIHYPDELMEIK